MEKELQKTLSGEKLVKNRLSDLSKVAKNVFVSGSEKYKYCKKCKEANLPESTRCWRCGRILQ